MEPMATAILLATLDQLVILVILVTPARLVILALVKSRMSLILPILEPMKVDSQTILFMTLLLERTRLGTLTTMKMYLLRSLSLENLMEMRRTSPVLAMAYQVNLINT